MSIARSRRVQHRRPFPFPPPLPLVSWLAATLATLAADGAGAACGPGATPGSNTAVTCDGTTTGSASVVAAPGSTGVTITVNPGATLSTNATQALLVRDASSITNNGQVTVSGGSGSARAAMVATGNDNTLTNNGAIRTTSGGTSGILVTSNSSTRTLIANNGSIVTTGGSSHGISTLGPGNTVVNNGTISAAGASAKGVYLQGGNLVANLLVNTGTIAATGANSPSGGADAVHANTLGATFFSRVENRAGATLSSANGYGYRGQNGNDVLVNAGTIEGHGGAGNGDAIYMGALGVGTLVLQTGSVIRGGADGGGGRANAFLEGSGTVDNAFRNFQNLTMRGTAWSWRTDASFSDAVRIESGRFELPATLTSPVIAVLPGTTVAGTGTFAGNVTNQGTLLPGPNDGANFGAFTVRGNYTGSGPALLQVNTVLGGDNSPSDKLVVDGGNASGSTAVRVVNRGGLGAPTLADGILVVQAVNGATTAPGAFSLAQAVEAGAYSYRLYRGGNVGGNVGGNSDSWYLRNSGYAVGGTVVGSLAEAVALLEASASGGVGGGGGGGAGPATSLEPVKLYRPEVALYSSMPLVVRRLGLAQLGTFHDRQGNTDMQLLAGDDGLGSTQASWGRVFGESTRQRLRGDADPQFDGQISGLQLGHDFLAATDGAGGRHRIGVLGGYTRASGDTSGVASGGTNTATGRLTVEGYSLGAYWTRVAASGWYSDAVLMASRYKADARSTLGRGGTPRGSAVTASLEAGYPLALGDNLTLQPQVQLVWQRSSLDDFDDGISAVRFQRDNAVTGRIGARLEGRVDAGGGTWRPYLKANLWHTFSGSNALFFGPTDQVVNRRNASALEVGAGVVGQVNKTVSVYGGLAYTSAVGNTEQTGVQGQLGVRLRW
ncbi:autotransporter outer membrane beta-barrel domain-containing protein [Variovorax sp. J22G73]|uniref:autotransporter family protein n=1 Tax=unclassified Variovorax TaxID=663243 RepID=UPI000D5DC4DB|nr:MULTISPECIES: autotransporter outer membrane beta-barrel domain-containing protein [unclassified Variovorax]MDM0009062.1 autotransporter outer membrane beta-barrel domain-containing protein [Variovorax sp. J22R203]MDM0101569.1 autotransporter outer membrane beta-barrel domain-containing protein [Variovorax sp. J22G73]